ncbi:MAG: hypothetical protein AB8I08_35660 [Sandaracinaceae bacterium]
MSEPDPLPESLQRMLAIEAEGEELPDGFASSLRAQLDVTLGPPGGDGGSGGGSPAGGSSTEGSATGGASTPPATPAGLMSWASHVGVFLVGAAVGAAVWSASGSGAPSLPSVPPATSVVVDHAEPEPTDPGAAAEPPPSDEAPVTGEEPPAATPRPPRRPPTPPPEPEPRTDDGRTLLRQARAALARRLPQDALAALAQHQADHPRSPLAEERAALTVQALAAAGQLDRARQEAALFRARYPRSIFLAGVREAANGSGDTQAP